MSKDNANTGLSRIIKRKQEHLGICLNKMVDESCTGFDAVHLSTISIPDNISIDSVNTSSNLFNETFSYPIMIAGMIGGIPEAQSINLRLAEFASSYNIPMGVGSQKIALLYPEQKKNFDFSSMTPSSHSYPYLISNIGMDLLSVNTPDSCLDLCLKAVDMIKARALAIHLNLLQELLQPEGVRLFDKILDKIIYINDHLGLPLIVKEVGMGMDKSSIKILLNSGISYIDIGGKGGTSWVKVEMLRSSSKKESNLYTPFSDEGYTTVESINNYTKVKNQDSYCIATGGIRSGIDVFKALSLGASFCGIGLEFLKHSSSLSTLTTYMEKLIKELKISMVLTGSSSIENIDPSKTRIYTTFTN